MSTLEVNKITPQGVATEVTLGDSGDTFTIPSGVTLTNNGTATGFGGGKIGQVVSVSNTNNLAISATTYYTVMSLAITPSATSSKILILHAAPSSVELSNTSNMGVIAFFRDATNITTSGHFSSFASYQGFSWGTGTGITYLDSPNTTSAITYSVQGRCDNASLTFNYNRTGQQRMMSLTLMEVLA